MAAPYGFGLSQEDERTEARALELRPGDRVLCIAGAGEMPLSLLALGAGEVTAVDTEAAQLHLAALKLAAIVALERRAALELLGFLPSPRAARRAAFEHVLPSLPAAARTFWAARRDVVERGAIWQGRYERYIRLLFWLARPVLRRKAVEALFAQPTLEAQRAHFDRAIGTPAVRRIFRIAFEPRIFGRGGMDRRSLQFRASGLPLGAQYFAQFRAFCTAHPARENPLLQLTLLGRLVGPDVTPACLSAEGVAAIRAHAGQLSLVHQDLRACLLARPAGTFEKIHLSNLADWLSEAEFAALLRAVAERAARPGRAVWRWLHVPRGVPEDLRAVLRAEPERGAALAAADRFPFYGVMPVSIGSPAPP